MKARLEAWQENAQVQFPKENPAFIVGESDPKDRLFTRNLALKERARDEKKLRKDDLGN